MEMLIVIAIVAVLISVAVPVLSSQLERSREAVDLANVRAAYAQVSTEALLGNTDITVTVKLKQKQAGWQSVDPVNIGGIVHSNGAGNTDNWQGDAEPEGNCVVSYNEAYGVVLTWNGTAAPVKPSHPFDSTHTQFFDNVLYKTDFWKNGEVKQYNFEFDSRCPGSKYIPPLEKELEKLNNSLLQQENCTWAFLGNPYDGRESERYLFWTSLNTNDVGSGVKIPVIIQTGDGKYYVSHTTTGERESKGGNYIAVSEHLYNDSQYKSVLKAGEKYDSLTDAYVAYLLAREEYEKSALDSN